MMVFSIVVAVVATLFVAVAITALLLEAKHRRKWLARK